MKQVDARGLCRLTVFFIVNGLWLAVFFPADVHAQSRGETATCEVRTKERPVNGKDGKNAKVASREKVHKSNSTTVRRNGAAYFEQLINIQPGEKVPVTVTYSGGRKGEKVSLLTMDGGTFDNGKITKVVSLNERSQITFSFQATTNEGIYRLVLQKGGDTRVLQLWAGVEIPAVKK